jgi:outer membrane receptor protein involved in Fe transport
MGSNFGSLRNKMKTFHDEAGTGCRYRPRCKYALAAVLFLTVISLPGVQARAQLESGSIFGTVMDPTGAVIPDAHIVVENTLTGARFDESTNKSGNYIAPVLPPGTYRVTASRTGFQTVAAEYIQLAVSERKQIDLKLRPGADTQTVTVTDQSPLLQTGTSDVGILIPSKEVNDLPENGRGIGGFLALVPSLNGAGTNWFQAPLNITVDGTDSSQIDSGFVGAAYNSDARITRASLDAIQEVQIQTSNFSAEWGQSQGGIMNIVTKSGTNQFHGSLFEYLRNENTDARNYFDPAPLYKPKDRLNQFGGSLGGPIRRNKLFFFGNYEGVRQLASFIFTNVAVPTQSYRDSIQARYPAGTPGSNLYKWLTQLPLPNTGITFDPCDNPPGSCPDRLGYYDSPENNHLTENTGSVRIDYQVTANDKLSFRWNGNSSRTLDIYGVAQGDNRDVPGLLQTARVSYEKIFSSTLYNEASVAWNRMANLDGSSDPEIRAQPFIFSIGDGGAHIGQEIFDIRVANQSFSYLDTLSWIRGKHQLKFGVQLIRGMQNKQLYFQQDMVFNTLDQYTNNAPFFVATLGYPMTGIRLLSNNVFVQDDYQVTPRLTFNLGLRYTYDTPPSEAHGQQENFNLATGSLDPEGTTTVSMPRTEFAPRFGFAYRLPWSDRTVVRGAGGVFYNDVNVAQAQEFVDNWKGANRIVFDFQQPVTADPFPALASLFPPNVWGMYKQWRNPHSYEWNLAVQQQITPTTSVQVAYVGNHYVDLAPPIDFNQSNVATGIRPNPNYGSVNIWTPATGQSYNGLQVTFNQRLSHGLTLNANYAWSHTLDYGNCNFSCSGWQNEFNLRGEYSNADFDQRQNFEADFLYQAPTIRRMPRWIGSGWQINGIVTAHTGAPYTVVTGVGPTNDTDGSLRPDWNPGVAVIPQHTNVPYGPQLNHLALKWPTGEFGDVGRNPLYGPGWVNLDSSLFKNFKLRENMTIQLRVEAFDTFNHPDFGNPNASFNGYNPQDPNFAQENPSFGQSLGTVGGPRQLQFAARIDF